MTDQFREAEATFSLLLEKFKEKKISQQEFADSLKQLRIKDDEGRFWVIGAQSGKWYAFENGEWIEAKPPSQMERRAICISCGFENDIEAESCARCGSRHDEASPETAAAADPPASAGPSERSPPHPPRRSPSAPSTSCRSCGFSASSASSPVSSSACLPG